MQAAIYAPAGFELTDDERQFFRDADPAGFILFKRNCDNQDQLLRLTDSLRDLTGRDDLPILVDQEGGRVARMKPPRMAGVPGRGDVRRPLSRRAVLGDRGGARQCPRDRR